MEPPKTAHTTRRPSNELASCAHGLRARARLPPTAAPKGRALMSRGKVAKVATVETHKELDKALSDKVVQDENLLSVIFVHIDLDRHCVKVVSRLWKAMWRLKVAMSRPAYERLKIERQLWRRNHPVGCVFKPTVHPLRWAVIFDGGSNIYDGCDIHLTLCGVAAHAHTHITVLRVLVDSVDPHVWRSIFPEDYPQQPPICFANQQGSTGLLIHPCVQSDGFVINQCLTGCYNSALKICTIVSKLRDELCAPRQTPTPRQRTQIRLLKAERQKRLQKEDAMYRRSYIAMELRSSVVAGSSPPPLP